MTPVWERAVHSVYHECLYVFSYFPFGFEGRMWDLIVSVPDHCLSFYFLYRNVSTFLDFVYILKCGNFS